MSNALDPSIVAAPDRRGPARRDPARLRAVEPTAPRRRPRLVYGVAAVVGALLIAGAQMALSVLTTQGSYEIASLTQVQRELAWEKQMLYDDVAGLSSPQFLAANAAALGMVIERSPSYLRLSDGAVLGTSDAAIGASSVDAIGRGSVPNALLAETPLVTDPAATIAGVPADTDALLPDEVANTPAPLTDGLPTPSTH